jgi:hypothetical protein
VKTLVIELIKSLAKMIGVMIVIAAWVFGVGFACHQLIADPKVGGLTAFGITVIVPAGFYTAWIDAKRKLR